MADDQWRRNALRSHVEGVRFHMAAIQSYLRASPTEPAHHQVTADQILASILPQFPANQTTTSGVLDEAGNVDDPSEDDKSECSDADMGTGEYDHPPHEPLVPSERGPFTEKISPETNVEWLQAAWPRVQLAFERTGFQAKLDLGKSSVTAVAIGDDNSKLPYSPLAAWQFVRLLTITNLPPSLAIEIVTGLRLHVHYQIGFGSSYGSLVNKEEFEKRRQFLVASQKHIYELSRCTIYVTECSFTAVGDYIQPLKAVKELMSLCLNSGYHPAYVIKHLEPGLNDEFGPFLTKLWNNKLENPDKWQDISWSKSLPISEDIANNLDVYRPQLESSLEEQGITWKVDVDKKSTTVSVISGDQRIIDKAYQILELMAKSTVDPEVILQIIDGSQQHVNLRLWNKGGLCKKFGGEEEVSLKWQEWLKGPTMKEIAEQMQCKFFLHEHGLTAVGTYDGLEMLRMVVEGFVVYNVDPAHFLVTIIEHTLSNETAKSHDKSSISASFTEHFPECNAWNVQDAWPMVKSSLDEHGILCDLKMADRSMTISKTVKTKDPQLFLRARILLELLGNASIPASLAIEIMNGRRQHIFLRIGHQEGGLCSRFGIEEDEYKKRLGRFMAADKDISDLTDTTIRHVCDSVLLLGRADVVGILGRDDGLEMARTLVEGYIVHGREHACVTEHRENKKSRKRKYREEMHCLREKTGNYI